MRIWGVAFKLIIIHKVCKKYVSRVRLVHNRRKMFEDEAISAAVATAKERISFPALKEEQIQIIRHIVNGKSCLCALPTGFGKVFAFMLRQLF